MDGKDVNVNMYIKPGRVIVKKDPGIMSTVVGSAVAVCIWDRISRFGGVCHYIYPEMMDKNKTTVNYGNVAIYVLVKSMKEFGSRQDDLETQIFGGAEPRIAYDHRGTYGPQNVKIARKVLNKYGIKITSEDTGGHFGRKISFNTDTNEVMVYKVEQLRKDDWHFL